MLPSSVRRVVSAATPPSTSSVIATLTSSGARAAFCSRRSGHQRRCSSSKPSSPDNGAKDLPASASSGQSSVPASSTSSSSKGTGERRKRKAKDSPASALAKQLPSVPSTQHLSQEALGLSTFFSLHRPISVTHSFPNTVTNDAFAAIFALPNAGVKSGNRIGRASDVISTLSRTVDQLEGPMAQMTINGNDVGNEDSAASTRIELRHPDGSESSVFVQLGNGASPTTGQFLPFRPPPLPQPRSTTSSEAPMAAAAEENDLEPSHRVYKAVLTIEETTDSDGQVKVVAHSPQLIEEDGSDEMGQAEALPRRGGRGSFLERMALRQLRYEDARQLQRLQRREDVEGDGGVEVEQAGDGMQAISVRRQKKLKMKKKKYKKLMRKTRNIRRKLDRI